MHGKVATFIGALGLAFALGTPQLASAQAPSGEVAAGYQFMRDSELDLSFPAGWFVSAGGHVSELLEIVGEVSGSRKGEADLFSSADITVLTFMAGPRYSRHGGTIEPFAQVLFGGARASASLDILGVSGSDSETAFAVQPGAGVDVTLTDSLSGRLMVDYRRIFFEGEATNEVRVGVGIVVGFGRR